MRWKECQPIFKCHCLFLFWIPALLCATDLNWVNITCGAPVGPSACVRIWVCACEWTCMWCFKPWSCAFYHTLTWTLKEEVSTVCLEWIQMVVKQLGSYFFPSVIIVYRPQLGLSKDYLQNYLSQLPYSLLEKAAGRSVKGLCVCVCVCVDALELCMFLSVAYTSVLCLYTVYAWLWCTVVQQWGRGCPAGAFRLIDTDNNTHNSQRFCP